MPFFSFMCEAEGCGRRSHEYRPKWTAEKPVCLSHGPMDRDWHAEARSHTPGQTYPFVTSNISGTPLEVRDAAHERELCRRYGVIKRDDAAFLEPMDERFDFGKYDHETRSWKGRGVKRREGSGAGMPGAWY